MCPKFSYKHEVMILWRYIAHASTRIHPQADTLSPHAARSPGDTLSRNAREHVALSIERHPDRRDDLGYFMVIVQASSDSVQRPAGSIRYINAACVERMR